MDLALLLEIILAIPIILGLLYVVIKIVKLVIQYHKGNITTEELIDALMMTLRRYAPDEITLEADEIVEKKKKGIRAIKGLVNLIEDKGGTKVKQKISQTFLTSKARDILHKEVARVDPKPKNKTKLPKNKRFKLRLLKKINNWRKK